MATAAILGCAGYTGQETLDRLLAHPELEPIALGSDSLAGRSASSLDPRLNGDLPPFVTNAEALASGADVVFLCLGHEAAAAIEPPDTQLVVDLSGAHRLRDAALYAEWYGFEHPRPGAWSYGLPELFEAEGPLVANPGCYATAALLALAPLAGVIDPRSVVVDAKSGVSGAGRGLKASSHAGFVLENLTPYRVGDHQHAPEIEQALGFPVCFVPHLLPVRRGLLATCYVHTDADARALLEDAYATSPAARVSKLGPDLAIVAGDGACAGAGMFTTNRVQAAPVVVSKEHLESAHPRAVVINSGNANAATGGQGLADARTTAESAAHLLGL